jgi:hypothetical protein
MENVHNQRFHKLYHFSPHVYAALRVVYRWTMATHRNMLRRVTDLSNRVLMDEYCIASPALRRLARRIARYTGEMAAVVQTLPGVPVHKLVGPNWTIVFVGTESSKRQLCHLFFEKDIQEVAMDRLRLGELSGRVRAWLAQDADLVICELGSRYPQRFTAPVKFAVPTWVDHTLSLPPSPDDLLAGHAAALDVDARGYIIASRKVMFRGSVSLKMTWQLFITIFMSPRWNSGMVSSGS